MTQSLRKPERGVETDINFNFFVAHLLLGPKVDEVGTHGEPLAVPQLGHAEVGGHVLVGHLVTNAPSHIHHLKKVRPSKIASCSTLQYRQFV